MGNVQVEAEAGQQDVSSVLEVIDKVLGVITMSIAAGAAVCWVLGHTSFMTAVLLLLFPLMNLAMTKLGSRLPRRPTEHVRVLLNVPLLIVIYCVSDGVLRQMWLPFLIMVIGNAQIWPLQSRRAISGYILTSVYASGFVFAAWLDGTPDWRSILFRVLGMGTVGVALATATQKLALSLAAIRIERRKSEQMNAELAKTLQDLSDAQAHLIKMSRIAGMAQVATGVLHNVGNVLNSVNVSAGQVIKTVEKSRVRSVIEISRLLKGQTGDLGEYLTRDGKGQKVIPLLHLVADELERERATVLAEAKLVNDGIGHIEVIVRRQQEIASAPAMNDRCTVAQIVEEAIRLGTTSFARHGCEIEIAPGEDISLVVDRHKVIEILVNLLANAKDAVATSAHKRITLRSRTEGDHVVLEVCDTGIGISNELKARIFNYGFTTKPTGHGFGLHSAANAAGAMGGKLTCASAGEGHGATFTLSLPLAPPVSVAA
jgi:signal transduction histidine kinase